jgi:osmoprotectant transport system permease protein
MSDRLDELWTFVSSDAAWSGRNGLPSLLLNHVRLSTYVVLAATVVAVPPAVVLGHIRRGGVLAVSIVNIGRAIPTFAMICLLFPLSLAWGFGLGFWPTFVALLLLAIPPIFTNTFTGVRDAPPDAVEAARGMGMRGRELIRRVELPVALPLVITGVRVAAVQVVATATLGPLVGYRNLGTPIITGFQSSDKGPLLAGAIAVVALALLTDAVFVAAERVLVPWRPRVGRADDVGVAAASDLTPSIS